jgi:hypothetical protein
MCASSPHPTAAMIESNNALRLYLLHTGILESSELLVFEVVHWDILYREIKNTISTFEVKQLGLETISR